MGNKEVAKDLTQATFTIVLARLRQLRDPGKLTSWIYRIAHNEAHAEVMRRGRLHLVAMDHQHDIEDAGQNKLEEMEKKERGELIQKALSTIPPEQLEVVILKQYEELTFREIADILSLSENTVKSRMYYALKALKKTLKDHPIIKDLYHEAS